MGPAWQTMMIVLISLVLAFLSMFTPLRVQAESESKPLSTDSGEAVSFISVQHGLLSVKVHQLPLQALLKEISRLSGVEIVIYGSITETVSMQFENLPLDEGLKRLVGSSGVMLVYEESSSQKRSPAKTALKKAIVLSKGEGISPGTTGQGDAPSDRDRAARLARAKALTSLATKSEIQSNLDVYLHTQDPGTKQKALDTFLGAFDDEDLKTVINFLLFGMK